MLHGHLYLCEINIIIHVLQLRRILLFFKLAVQKFGGSTFYFFSDNHRGIIELVKSDNKDMYNVTKDFS